MVTLNPEVETPESIARTRADSRAFPERITAQGRTLLAAADAVMVFIMALLALNGGDGSRIAAAVAVSAVVCGMFWLCGYYRRSYAVFPRDEVYYACAGVALAAIPILIILTGVGDIPLVSVIVALLLAALGTSVLRVRMHMERRGKGEAPYAGICSVSPSAWHDREQAAFEAAKRIFDVVVALAALIVFSPVMIAATIAIACEANGPVFFRQERIGKNGRSFKIFKFRTMRPDAGSAWVTPGDDRITRVGGLLRRTSMDELPQLFNVLRGEMSIVGPRPEMVSFASKFAHELPFYTQRTILAPGITGWAQVYLKRNLQPGDMPAVLPYDLFYIEHSSVLLDAAIVFKTAAEVLFHRAV